MANIFVKPRGRGHELLQTARRDTEGPPPALVVVAVGTAGAKRALLFLQRMSEVSEIGRVQTAIFYDCNRITKEYIEKFLRKFLGKSKHGQGVQILFPAYIPIQDGFMREPQAFEEFQGPLDRDMDRMVDEVKTQAERCGQMPETILEFMGFSGHAVLGGQLHRKLREAFPNALMLPVLMLPHDHISEKNTKRFIWKSYEDLLSGSQCLLTSSVGQNAAEDDVRLATGLAGVEVAGFLGERGVISPLAAVCQRLGTASGGWLGMATAKRQMQMTRRFEWLRLPPWWRWYAALGPDDELPIAVGDAIMSTMTKPSQMVEGVTDRRSAPQELVVSLPVHPESLEPLAMSAGEVLERSNWFSEFPNMDIAFNTARFPDRRAPKDLYMHITRLYPVQGELAPVMNILHPGRSVAPELAGGENEAEFGETGFGTKYHLEGPAAPPAIAAARPRVDWNQNVRYT